MKITETVTRECCQKQDLCDYKAAYPRSHPLPAKMKFCKHCGRWWVWDRPAGEMDGGLYPVTVEQWRIGG